MKPKGTNLQIFVSNIFCGISKLAVQRTMYFLFLVILLFDIAMWDVVILRKKLYDWKSIPDVLRAELLYPVDKSEEHEFILIASKIIPVGNKGCV